jgi:hypothetical protein
LSQKEANRELANIVSAMKSYEIVPTSFIFPANSIAHLDMLPKYGFRCYREYGNFLKDGMYIRRHNCLWDVHPTLYVERHTMFVYVKRILDICIHKKLPFHLWFHLWNLGQTQVSLQRMIKGLFYPLLRYAKLRVRSGELDIETMASALHAVEGEI